MSDEPLNPQAGGASRLSKESSAADFEALLDAAVDGIIVTDQRGRILRFNKATIRMFGYPPDELMGQVVGLIMTERDARAHQTYMGNYQRTGQKKIIGVGREVVARRKDGSVFPVALSIGEAQVHNSKHFVGLIRDLTEQKQAEEEALRQRDQISHASRLTTMGEMAAAMAHELNQPLSAISNYTAASSRLLDQEGEQARADVRLALREIGDQAHRAAEVIKRIRAFATSRTVNRHPVQVSELIAAILPLARMDAKANHVDLHIRLDDDLPSINADPIQIQQVILNLMRNGVDAMQGLPESRRRLDLRAGLQGPEQIRIAITDRGPGVSDVARDQLFTAFFTTKETGMGMGLAISRSIIAAHGGRLDFVNNPLEGATFFVLLPTSLGDE